MSPVGEIKARLNITVQDSAIQKQDSTAVRYSPGRYLTYRLFAGFDFEQARISRC